MTHLRIPGDSVEYIRVPIATLDSAGVLDDPTAAAIEIGFSADKDTEPTSWHTAAWETSENIRTTVGGTIVDSPYKARLLVGTGATELAVGTHHTWIRITDAPETPVRYAGIVEVY